MSKITHLAVFCGSKTGANPNYTHAAKHMAEALLKRSITLVYGGGRVGIMGVLADSVLSSGGSVIGVMPQFLIDKEVAHKGLTQFYCVQSMHERKTQMAKLSQGFILLPGGAGSLEEFFEVFTWSYLELHQKPCAILNVDGYYDSLIAFLDQATKEGFITEAARKKVIVAHHVDELLAAIDAAHVRHGTLGNAGLSNT